MKLTLTDNDGRLVRQWDIPGQWGDLNKAANGKAMVEDLKSAMGYDAEATLFRSLPQPTMSIIEPVLAIAEPDAVPIAIAMKATKKTKR